MTTKPCPKCGQLGHNARRHNGESQKSKAALRKLRAKQWRDSTGNVSDPITEEDWSELDDIR